MYSLFNYLLFGILNRSALNFVFVVAEISQISPYYARIFSYYAGIMLYAF